MNPSEFYSQNLDKQRIVIVGSCNTFIVKLIKHTLAVYEKPVSFAEDKDSNSQAPAALIETDVPSIAYEHHIVVACAEVDDIVQMMDHSPKGGSIIYDETLPTIKKAATKERANVNPIPFSEALFNAASKKHTFASIPSVPKSDICCAMELLRRLGITPQMFAASLASFPPVA